MTVRTERNEGRFLFMSNNSVGGIRRYPKSLKNDVYNNCSGIH